MKVRLGAIARILKINSTQKRGPALPYGRGSVVQTP